MDIVTQGLAGAVLAQGFARPGEVRRAAAVGFCAGLLADVDALFTQSAADPLLQLEFHRHFTHALLFIPAGGLIAALLLHPLLRRHLPFARLLGYATAGYATSGLLDACTSYGTHLLWPLSEERVAWNVISILDPLFSLALVGAIALAARKRRPAFARVGIAFALLYFGAGFVQHERAETMALRLAAERGHAIERLEVKPTMANLLLWRGIYESGGRFYIDAFRPGVLAESRVYEGDSVERFTPEMLPTLEPGSTQAADIRRFIRFSDGYVVLRRGERLVVGDVRYAMLPDSIEPLWGVELDLDHPRRHTPFNSYRDAGPEVRARFVDMLLGR